MKREFLSHTGSRRLVIMFLGWGMDSTPFRNLRKSGYDILLVWDYNRMDLRLMDRSLKSKGYIEIVVIAWSFGVRACVEFLEKSTLPITLTIAVNGTEQHIDDSRGIPVATFDATCRAMSDVSLLKFYRRMFRNQTDYNEFLSVKPQRELRDIKHELGVFAGILYAREKCYPWSRVIIGGADLIFPSDNQRRAWDGMQVDIYEDMPHFPDFQMILDSYVVDKDLVAERFGTTRETYRENGSVQLLTANRLWELAKPYLPLDKRMDQVIEVGVGDGFLTKAYSTELRYEILQLWDIAPINIDGLPDDAIIGRCDAEIMLRRIFPQSVSVLMSASTIQWFNDPVGFICTVAHVLEPGGMAVLSMFGPGTLREIKQVAGKSLKYPDPEALRSAAERSGLAVCSFQREELKIYFDSAKDALDHLRLTGVNALSRSGGSLSAIRRLLREFPVDADGRVALTYCPVYMVFKRKNDHE